MNTENNTRQVKYPENRKVRAKLLPGDRSLIVEYSGYSHPSINGMLNGDRRLTDRAKDAIVRVLKDREDRNKALTEISNTQPLIP